MSNDYEKNCRKKLAIILSITLTGLVCASLFHYILSLTSDFYPHNTFLFHPSIRFSDFFDVTNEAADLNPYLGNGSAQYPLLCLIGYLLGIVLKSYGYSVYGAFIIICVLSWISLIYFLNKLYTIKLSITGISLILLTCYPFLFAVDRGNFEILVFSCVFISLYAYASGNRYLSGFFLASAASMKLFPIYYLVIFLKDRKYREIAFSLTCFAFINIFIIMLFKGGIYKNMLYLFNNGNVNNNFTFRLLLYNTDLFQRSSSLYNALKIVLVKTNIYNLNNAIAFLSFYKIMMLTIALLLAIVIIQGCHDFWQSVLISSIVVILLPYISADYKMLYLLLPIVFFLYADTSKYTKIYSILFGLALIPKSFYLLGLKSDSRYNDISIAALINPLLLVLLLLITLYQSAKLIDSKE